MSDPIDALIAARHAIDDAIIALGGAGGPVDSAGGIGNPDTDPLSAEGLWQPPLLARLIAATKRAHPTGWMDKPNVGFDGRPARAPVLYPRAFWFQRCASRLDLTEDQRRALQTVQGAAFVQGIADSGHMLNDRPADQPLTGGYASILAVVYDNDLPRLERDIRRYFHYKLGVSVDGDTGGL